MRTMCALVALAAAPGVVVAQTWDPPVGVPAPPFGIEESHRQYDGVGGYADAGDGPYSHYVDNTAGNCSDSGSGTAAVPRCSIPSDVPVGSVVEIHGGPYGGNTLTLGGTGTANQPIFYRGTASPAPTPVIDDVTFEIAGSYVVVENVEVTGSPTRVGTGGDHVCLRHSHVHHHPTGSLVVASGSDIVIYDNSIHHNTRTGNDGHGVHVAEGAVRVWVVDNDVHHHTGDGIQFCHGCTGAPPSTVYVGRNRFYTNRENGVDIKYATNVVISENVIYDHRSAPADVEWCFEDNSLCGTWSSGSDGSAVVLGSDGGPSNIWFVANEVYDSAVGVRNEETYDAWIVGNVIHDIAGSAIALEKVGQPLVISHNTITTADVGVDQFWQPNFVLTISNNIFVGLHGRFVNIETDTVAAASTLDANLFWNDGAAVSLRWVTNQSFASTADFSGFAGGTGNLVAAPGFAGVEDLRLLDGSAAIDAGNEDLATIDADFRAAFGSSVTLLRDRDGVVRPVDGDESGGAENDIGAYEYSPGGLPADGGPSNDGGGPGDGVSGDGTIPGDGGVVGPSGDANSGGALSSGCSCATFPPGLAGVMVAAVCLRRLRSLRSE